MRTRITLIIIASLFLPAVADGLTVGGSLQQYTDKVRQSEEEREFASSRAEIPAIDAPALEMVPGEKVFIKAIKLNKGKGVRLDKVVAFETANMLMGKAGREMTLEDMTGIAAETESVIKDGQMDAYVPEQEFRKGVLYINIVKQTR
ncbi:MAG: hypothetical protein PHH49_05245 [Candidatus Omnitrophica bacterium]|nr:hypothetical protein [Candidatus Omnitrophota bacterium]MDD5488347.1 hypothetical protein [Candidatus Omnitrophota bacterium]